MGLINFDVIDSLGFGSNSWAKKDLSKHKRLDELKVPPCVHKNDGYVINMIEPDMQRGPWIAGGAALSWYKGEAVGNGDIDVFCKNEQQAQQLIDSIKQYTDTRPVFESKNAVSFNVNHHSDSRSWRVQVITKKYFDTVEECINLFDITVCQVGTDGFQFKLGAETAKHINEKALRFRQPYQPDIVKRLIKYWTYGYEPEGDLISTLIENEIDYQWAFSRETEEYENALGGI